MSTPNFSPLSDDLWGSSFNTPQQQQQQQQMMSPPPQAVQQMPPQHPQQAIPPSRTQAELQHLRQIVYQMAAKMQENKANVGSSGGGDNGNLLKWIVILLGILVFLFLVKLIIYWKRNNKVSLMSSSPLYSSPGYSPGSATFSPGSF